MALLEEIRHLEKSIKHNKKAVEKLQQLIKKDEESLKILERKTFICPICNKRSVLPINNDDITCQFCGSYVTKTNSQESLPQK